MFGDRMKQRRQELGILQKEAANLLQIEPALYCNYENNKNFPASRDTIAKIAQTLGTTVDWLFELTDNHPLAPIIKKSEKKYESHVYKVPNGKTVCTEKSCEWRRNVGNGQAYCPCIGCLKESTKGNKPDES